MSPQAAEGRSQHLENLRLLLEQVYGLTGYDFRDYSLAVVARRVSDFMRGESLVSMAALRDLTLSDPRALGRLIDTLAARSSQLFRDPDFFAALVRDAAPLLRTYPSIKVWNVGCGTGEETYSLAIALRQCELLERSLIYATELAPSALRQAREGSYPVGALAGAAERFAEAGLRGRLNEHCTIDGPLVTFSKTLKNRIVFMEHSLATDGSLNEFHLVVCRDLIPQFNRALQERVYGLIDASLCPLGILALGRQHTLGSAPLGLKLRPLGDSGCLYRLTP